MHHITFISTIHKGFGKCNSNELFTIIKRLNPEVIFLEALEDSYSKYDRFLFESFGMYHKKLEIAALQKYAFVKSFEYVPVLNKEMSEAFEKKYNLICDNIDLQNLIEKHQVLSEMNGFDFLNSSENIRLHDEMRKLECYILDDYEVEKEFNEAIEEYEDSMIRNIYSYCKDNHFFSAIYMCGSAHRKSIIEKIGKINKQENLKLNWIVYENLKTKNELI